MVADLSPDVDEIEAQLFLEAIYLRYGYDLRDYAAASLRRRLTTALSKSRFADLGQLQHAILHDPVLFATVLDDLTVRVSEMFRDPEFFRSFRANVVPLLRTYPLLRIWHVGCATGEEAYSMAILLSEEGLYDRTQIYATDLNSQAILHAKQGFYSAAQLKSFTNNYQQAGGAAALSDYYTAAYDRIAIRDSLRRNILFFQHNVVSDHTFGEMHAVLCRNVLIYFGARLRHEVATKLVTSLCHGGFFCLGSSERVARGEDLDLAEFIAGDRIYRQHARKR